ncbi:MAG: hypothetical protein P3X24_005930 [bacterium]|nr:hypothetical protein [bacterium]
MLYQDFALLIPTTQFLLQTYDSRNAERDRVFYPEIPDPEHLEHFFVGNLTRTISAPDAQESDTWTIDAEGVQWCGGAMGWNWMTAAALSASQSAILPIRLSRGSSICILSAMYT